MKTILMTLGILMINFAFSNNNPSINREIEKKVQPDLSQYNFDQENENFVIVRFTVNNQQVEIIDILGSNEELIEIMKDELKHFQ